LAVRVLHRPWKLPPRWTLKNASTAAVENDRTVFHSYHRHLTTGHSISAAHPRADPLCMKHGGRRRVGLACQHRGRFFSGALSPDISRTRSPASTPDCCHRSQTGEHAF
jgi:hypothetical protein